MKYIDDNQPLLFSIIVGLGLLCAVVAGARPAPSFSAELMGGNKVSLKETLKPKRMLLVSFWASWCTPCRRSFPWMNDLDARYRDRGLTIVAINVDKRRDDALRFLRDVPARFTVAFDAEGKTPAAFDVKGMPSSYLIDREGRVATVEEGFHEERTAAIEQRIRALLDRH